MMKQANKSSILLRINVVIQLEDDMFCGYGYGCVCEHELPTSRYEQGEVRDLCCNFYQHRSRPATMKGGRLDTDAASSTFYYITTTTHIYKQQKHKNTLDAQKINKDIRTIGKQMREREGKVNYMRFYFLKKECDQNRRGMNFFFMLLDQSVRQTSNSLSLTDLGDLWRLSLLMEFSISGMVYERRSILLLPMVEVSLLSNLRSGSYALFHFILILGMISSSMRQLWMMSCSSSSSSMGFQFQWLSLSFLKPAVMRKMRFPP